VNLGGRYVCHISVSLLGLCLFGCVLIKFFLCFDVVGTQRYKHSSMDI